MWQAYEHSATARGNDSSPSCHLSDLYLNARDKKGKRTMSTPPWAPDDMPLDKPNAARMYDYFLGGYHNFAIDRAAAEQVIAI